MIKRALRGSWTFSLSSANGSRSAIRLARDYFFDLILMDVNLGHGEISGTRCVELLRDQGYRGIIFMMTGDNSVETMSTAFLAGADDYIVKGSFTFSPVEVNRLIKKYRRADGSEISQIDTIKDSVLLRSLGLGPGSLNTLARCFAERFDTEKAAAQLEISGSTLHRRLSRIYSVLGIKNKTQLARLLTVASDAGAHKSREAI